MIGKVADTIHKVRRLYLRNKNFEEDNYRNKNFWCGVVGVLGIIGVIGKVADTIHKVRQYYFYCTYKAHIRLTDERYPE